MSMGPPLREHMRALEERMASRYKMPPLQAGDFVDFDGQGHDAIVEVVKVVWSQDSVTITFAEVGTGRTFTRDWPRGLFLRRSNEMRRVSALEVLAATAKRAEGEDHVVTPNG